jgi:hypothetical protein
MLESVIMAIAGVGAAAAVIPLATTLAPVVIGGGMQAIGVATSVIASLSQSMSNAQRDNPNQVPAG